MAGVVAVLVAIVLGPDGETRDLEMQAFNDFETCRAAAAQISRSRDIEAYCVGQ